jgi:hypothetical protein
LGESFKVSGKARVICWEKAYKYPVKRLLFFSKINRQSGVISRERESDDATDRTTNRATDRAK